MRTRKNAKIVATLSPASDDRPTNQALFEAGADVFRLDLAAGIQGDSSRVMLPHPEIFAVLQPGAELLLDDGRVRLCVEQCGPNFADRPVVHGGRLSDRKGVNVPGVVLPLSALTE